MFDKVLNKPLAIGLISNGLRITSSTFNEIKLFRVDLFGMRKMVIKYDQSA